MWSCDASDVAHEHIRSLADKMKAEGFKSSKPLEVVILEEGGVDRLVVTDGHCRLAAVKIALAEGATIKQVPCVTLPSKGTSPQDLIAGLVTSNSGKPLTTYETALVCKRLFNYGWEEAQIAKRLTEASGYSHDQVELAKALVGRELVRGTSRAANLLSEEARFLMTSTSEVTEGWSMPSSKRARNWASLRPCPNRVSRGPTGTNSAPCRPGST